MYKNEAKLSNQFQTKLFLQKKNDRPNMDDRSITTISYYCWPKLPEFLAFLDSAC